MTTKFQTLTTNTTSNEFLYSSDGIPGLQFNAIGTFGGGTLKLQQKHSDETFRDIVDASFTANATKLVDVANGTIVRAVLTGATSPGIFIEFVSMGLRTY